MLSVIEFCISITSILAIRLERVCICMSFVLKSFSFFFFHFFCSLFLSFFSLCSFVCRFFASFIHSYIHIGSDTLVLLITIQQYHSMLYNVCSNVFFSSVTNFYFQVSFSSKFKSCYCYSFYLPKN